MTPPRSGIGVIISPWEFRHLSLFAALHIGGGLVATAVGLLVLGLGGPNWTAFWWALGFCAVGVSHLAVGYWELRFADSIARSGHGKDLATQTRL